MPLEWLQRWPATHERHTTPLPSAHGKLTRVSAPRGLRRSLGAHACRLFRHLSCELPQRVDRRTGFDLRFSQLREKAMNRLAHGLFRAPVSKMLGIDLAVQRSAAPGRNSGAKQWYGHVRAIARCDYTPPYARRATLSCRPKHAAAAGITSLVHLHSGATASGEAQRKNTRRVCRVCCGGAAVVACAAFCVPTLPCTTSTTKKGNRITKTHVGTRSSSPGGSQVVAAPDGCNACCVPV